MGLRLLVGVDSFFAVGDLPGSTENELRGVFYLIKIDFVYGVCGFVVVGMCTAEIENEWDIVFGKIVMV